ncbi:MAG: response regulator [Oligoflexia bacterium]|nr:response regulator [Oligoflexia bacterium]
MSDPHSSGDSLVRLLTDQSELFLFSYSPEMRTLTAWSANSESVLGVKDVDIARDGNLFLRHVHPDDRFHLMNDLEAALRGEHTYRSTYRWIRPDNDQVRWLHCRASVLQHPNCSSFDGVIMDLSVEFTGVTARLAGPDSLTSVLAAFPALVFTLDSDFRILRINRSRTPQNFNFGDPSFKHEQFMIGKNFLSCFEPGEPRAGLSKALSTGLSEPGSTQTLRFHLEELVYSLEIMPITEQGIVAGLLCIITDTTEVVNSERQLAELRKREGLRILAAGVAHNFNNSLQAIIGQAAAMQSHPADAGLVNQASQAIIEIVNRTSKLAHQLFADDTLNKELLVPTDINLCVMNAASGLDHLASSEIKVSVAFGNPPVILARAEELSEAIRIILLNSRESLAAGGTISIKTYQTHLADFEIEQLKAGDYAKLTIADSGCGMEPEILRRCFEPFYSTKPPLELHGSTRGLGLPRALSIVRSLNGGVTIESRPGQGTTVAIYLPAERQSDSNARSQRLKTPGAPQILVIDDDSMVLATMESLLNDMGYNCLVADDYRNALQLIRARQHELSLVLLDAVMPGMDGVALLRRIKRIAGTLKVVGFSGAPPELTRSMLEAGALKILRKPVDPETLRRTVREIIEVRDAA